MRTVTRRANRTRKPHAHVGVSAPAAVMPANREPSGASTPAAIATVRTTPSFRAESPGTISQGDQAQAFWPDPGTPEAGHHLPVSEIRAGEVASPGSPSPITAWRAEPTSNLPPIPALAATPSSGQGPLTCRHSAGGIRCNLILVPSRWLPGYYEHLVPPAVSHYCDPMRVSSSASRTSSVPELVMASPAPGPQALLVAAAALEESPA
jgi:hypothetical protein